MCRFESDQGDFCFSRFLESVAKWSTRLVVSQVTAGSSPVALPAKNALFTPRKREEGRCLACQLQTTATVHIHADRVALGELAA